MKEAIIQKILDEKVIAIIRGSSEDECLSLARALHAGGVNMLEVTFDQSSEELRLLTERTIKRLNDELGGEMVFGAGTVTTPEMVRMAFDAGAKFIISPDTDPAVIKETVRLGMVSIPGAFTPSEIKQAHVCGADFVKVFPASKLGPSYIKDVTAPLNNVRLLAVGGVDGSNIRDYLAAGAVGAGVAGCLFKKDWIKNGEWDKVTEASKKFTAILRGEQ
ncbi:MAG: bifunctional 4-hydroxy-2-oxoglutarate aldolase/2-dehydro-3-deoxy-phosphogluconate aldolase [Firmicutes bacterium]|nr:bifunctional 4-hydroxy-2-oxoglutarate aldolase/2-dehydro-3-deoxy-phosphogluconate aldolase [Bacillota bacterium]